VEENIEETLSFYRLPQQSHMRPVSPSDMKMS
jgi:hypothetical protein